MAFTKLCVHFGDWALPTHACTHKYAQTCSMVLRRTFSQFRHHILLVFDVRAHILAFSWRHWQQQRRRHFCTTYIIIWNYYDYVVGRTLVVHRPMALVLMLVVVVVVVVVLLAVLLLGYAQRAIALFISAKFTRQNISILSSQYTNRHSLTHTHNTTALTQCRDDAQARNAYCCCFRRAMVSPCLAYVRFRFEYFSLSFLFRPIFGGRQKCSTPDYFFVFSLTGPTVRLFVCSCRFLLQYFCCCWWSVSFCRTNSENSCLPAEMMVTQFSHYRTWIYYVCCVVFVRKTKWSMCSPLYSVLWCLLLAFATVYSVFYVLCATILSRCANYAR